MGRRRKELLFRFLTNMEDDEPPEEGENVNDKAIVLSAANEAELLETAGMGKMPCGETFMLSETNRGNETHEPEAARHKRDVADHSSLRDPIRLVSGVCLSKALIVCPDSRDQQENVQSCSAVIERTGGISEKDLSWPFIKNSGIWKTIDCMDIFRRMPQMPHFSPLNEYEENSREKHAICLMMRFAYEVDNISRFSPDDLKNTSIIKGSLESLEEFESHGFYVTRVKAYLEDVSRKNELQQKLEEVESEIRKRETEKMAAENEINHLIEQLRSLQEKLVAANLFKTFKDQELAKLESAKSTLCGEIHSLQLGFRRKADPFW